MRYSYIYTYPVPLENLKCAKKIYTYTHSHGWYGKRKKDEQIKFSSLENRIEIFFCIFFYPTNETKQTNKQATKQENRDEWNEIYIYIWGYDDDDEIRGVVVGSRGTTEQKK